jgi:DNA-binding transcriptional MerR regulator
VTPERQVPRYRVAAVERMTGIPASTLRSWERRHGWPRPVRAPSGQRLYSDHDLAVVRFLDRRRVEGMSMSQATGLLGSAPATTTTPAACSPAWSPPSGPSTNPAPSAPSPAPRPCSASRPWPPT